jgi:hypothetical protein
MLAPRMQIFSAPDCGGVQADLPSDTQDYQLSPSSSTVIGPNQMSSAYVPPNMLDSMWQIWDGTNHAFSWVKPGLYSQPDQLVFPRAISRDSGATFTEADTMGYSGNNQMNWPETVVPWATHLEGCCMQLPGYTQAACTSPKGTVAFGVNNAICSGSVQSYCKSGDPNTWYLPTLNDSVNRAFNEPKCASWYNGLGGVAGELNVKTNVCNGPGALTNPQCRDWCRRHRGACDAASATYCAPGGAGAKTSYCGCINSPVTKYNPECVDTWCISGSDASGIGGYTPSYLSDRPCPQIVDCSTQLEMTAGGRIITGAISIQQNCGNTGGGSTPCGAQSNCAGTTIASGVLGDRVCGPNGTNLVCTATGWTRDGITPTCTTGCPVVGALVPTPPVSNPPVIGGGPVVTPPAPIPVPVKSSTSNTSNTMLYIILFIIVLAIAAGGIYFMRQKKTNTVTKGATLTK